MAKASKSDRKGKNKGRKASDKSDRQLLELGEDLLTAVHLHQAVQEDEVRAALASAHGDLVQAVGDLVARIAARLLEEGGVEIERPRRVARVEEQAGADEEPVGDEDVTDSEASPSH